MLLSTDTNITIGPAVDRCPCEYLVALGVYRFHFFLLFFPFSLIFYLSCFPIVRSYSAPFNGCVTAGVTTGSIASNYTVHYATRLSSIFFFVVKLPLFASHLFLFFWFWPSIDHGQPSRHSWLSIVAPSNMAVLSFCCQRVHATRVISFTSRIVASIEGGSKLRHDRSYGTKFQNYYSPYLAVRSVETESCTQFVRLALSQSL